MILFIIHFPVVSSGVNAQYGATKRDCSWCRGVAVWHPEVYPPSTTHLAANDGYLGTIPGEWTLIGVLSTMSQFMFPCEGIMPHSLIFCHVMRHPASRFNPG